MAGAAIEPDLRGPGGRSALFRGDPVLPERPVWPGRFQPARCRPGAHRSVAGADAAGERHHDRCGRDGAERSVAGARSRAADAAAARRWLLYGGRVLQGVPARRQFSAAAPADQVDLGDRRRNRPFGQDRVRAHRADDDAAAGQAGGLVRVAGFPRARLRGVSRHGRRADVPGDDQRTRNADPARRSSTARRIRFPIRCRRGRRHRWPRAK